MGICLLERNMQLSWQIRSHPECNQLSLIKSHLKEAKTAQEFYEHPANLLQTYSSNIQYIEMCRNNYSP